MKKTCSFFKECSILAERKGRKAMPTRNYQREMEAVFAQNAEPHGRLLLHCCCAPCASYVLETLSPHFSLTAYYDNPNIDTAEEYAHRAAELTRLAAAMPLPRPVDVHAVPYAPEVFYQAVKGLESEAEGGARCYACYALRLRRAAEYAAAGKYDYFTTSLSISPHKNAVWLNELGERFAAEYGVYWLPSDFKKKNGFKRSTELAAQYGLYRQNYCGCVFSKREAEARGTEKAKRESGSCPHA